MAESVISGLVQTIIESLGSQILQEIGKICDFKKELDKLDKTVSRIEAVLKDAEEKQSYSHQVKDLIDKLEDAVKEIKELVIEFRTKASRQRERRGNKVIKEVRTFFSNSNPIALRYEMSGKIEAVRKKLDDIAKDNRDFKVKVIPEHEASSSI